jgi:hypothetical protein
MSTLVHANQLALGDKVVMSLKEQPNEYYKGYINYGEVLGRGFEMILILENTSLLELNDQYCNYWL